MKKLKNMKGITLIALVITIVVLLILAGVTIAMLTGDNGILTKAQSAKKVTADAEIEEKLRLAVMASKINVNNTIDTETLKIELNNQFGAEGTGWTKTEVDSNTWKVVVNGKSYKIDLTTGAIEKVTGIIVSASPSKVLAGKTATITATLDGIDKTGDISFTANPSSAATISDINQTAEGATATVTIASNATGSIDIEGKLDDEHKEKCTIKVVLDVTNATVNSSLEVEIGSTLDIANCITNKDSIEHFTITNVTGNATKENETTIKGTGTDAGTATVTITGTQSEKIRDDITVAVNKPEVLGVGSYVNYPVDYVNVNSDAGDHRFVPDDKYAGKWRILELGDYDTNTKTYSNTKIISAGVPLNYQHSDYGESITSVTNLTTGFFNTPIDTTGQLGESYHECGFKNNGAAVATIEGVKALFNNVFTAKDTSNNPVVQSMTKEELDKVYDPTGSKVTTGAYQELQGTGDLLVLENKGGNYNSCYWLATRYAYPTYTYLVHYMDGVQQKVSWDEGSTYGVRPVVSLQSGISITKGENGVWNITKK